jgi:hypothetical protein
MSKGILVALLGVFVGALVVEILRRKRPKPLRLLEDRASKAAHAVAQAFREGFDAQSELPTTDPSQGRS